MEDSLSFLDDHALAQEPVTLPPPEPIDPWWEKFRYDLYDWNDPEFNWLNQGEFAYRPVPVLGGYFMMCSLEHYELLTRHKDGTPKLWHRKVDRNENGDQVNFYARRTGRGDEPADVYAHREVLGIIYNNSKVGDHTNRWGLDNRGKPNLRAVKKQFNDYNGVRNRTIHLGLKRGVELRGKDAQGRQLYGGSRRVRISKTKVLAIRSKETWLDPDKAAGWYQKELEKISGCAEWAHNPATVNWPFFPPLLESEPAFRTPAHEQYAELPF